MKITHYFLHKDMSTSTKNKLQEEVHTYLKSLHGKLVAADDLQALQETILKHIQALNEKHKRSKPLPVSWWPTQNNIQLSGVYFTTLRIIPAFLTKIENLNP